MSVFLLVFRLEVAECCPTTPNLCYHAKHFDTKQPESGKLLYAEAPASVKPVVKEEILSRHRGHREFCPITIETYSRCESKGMSSEQDRRRVEEDEAARKTRMRMESPTMIDIPSTGSKYEDSSYKPKKPKPSLGSDQGSGHASSVSKRSSSLDEADSVHPSTSRDQLSAAAGKLVSKDWSSIDEGDGGDDASWPAVKSRGKSHSPTAQLPQTIGFFSGNPLVETTEGIIHLYKDSHMTPLEEDVPRSEMICILTVPASMTSQDLLQFAAPAQPWIESMKIIRDGTPNKYMVLVKFSSQKYADEFYKNFNNQPFNMIEPETCHLVYVAKVETVKEGDGGSLPVAGLTELPVCPVCLERMDESVDGILTILCNHTFHGSCLAQWGDTSCPVCRYIQTPEPVEDHKCFECDSQESLWICLICGHVGCGRYVGGHAYRHFQETQHCYSMQLGNNRVWDYAGDNYVHRLIQNKGDGKLVEVDEGGNVIMQDEKLDSITLEYTYLLTSQLESQRRYFEEKIEHIEKEALKQTEEVELRSKATLEECSRLEQKLAIAHKERQTLEKKEQQLHAKMTKALTELTEEREMNKCLLANQADWQVKVSHMEEKLEIKDKEVKELQEQLRDVMFYLEAQQKISAESAATQQEIQEGQVIVGAAAAPKKGRKKGR